MDNQKKLSFNFESINIKLPYHIVVNQYEWLSKLFNINMNCLVEKQTLDFDISSYISIKNNQNLRHMLLVMKKMEKYLILIITILMKLKK